MEFWGVEVPAGKPVTVKPKQGERIHISQVTFRGEKGEQVLLSLKIDGNEHVAGTLIQGLIPQLTTNLVFHRDFELSHDRAKGSVHYSGFKSPDIKLDEALISDEENEDPAADEGSEDDSGEDKDEEFADEEDSGEEEETPKQPEPSDKKRASESASKAPASKKAKTAATVTPQKTDDKKKEGQKTGKSPVDAN